MFENKSPSFSWTGDTDTGIYSPAADQVAISCGGIQGLLITNSGVTALNFNGITALASAVSPMNGIAAVGVSSSVARQDHIHASDTSKANINQTMYIGTTALAINRVSASQALTGITSIDGSASKWTTARNIALTGSVTGNVNIDGSGNVSIATTTNHTHPQSQITDDNNHQIERTIQVKCVSITSTIPSTLSPIDGYTPVAGDLVLLASANGGVNDGVYEVKASGTAWTRYSLYSNETQVVDRFVKVLKGTILVQK